MELAFGLVVVFSLTGAPLDDGAPVRDLSAEQRATHRKMGKECEQLRNDGHHAKAIARAQDSVSFVDGILGTSHWRTAEARQYLVTLRRMAALSPTLQRRLDEEMAKVQRGNLLTRKRKYAEAEVIYREAL